MVDSVQIDSRAGGAPGSSQRRNPGLELAELAVIIDSDTELADPQRVHIEIGVGSRIHLVRIHFAEPRPEFVEDARVENMEILKRDIVILDVLRVREVWVYIVL